MEIWTTFTPRKVVWELTSLLSEGVSPSYNWIDNLDLVKESLIKLKQAGIVGIRLVIYPQELTKDAVSFDFKLIDLILDCCQKYNIKVDFCLGPFQYPHYPGIYLPDKLLSKIRSDQNFLDQNSEIKNYALNFLELQLDKFGNDQRINGFHLANEWPDSQRIEKRRELKISISKTFMLEITNKIVKMTNKNVSINTNKSPLSIVALNNTFSEILNILKSQGKLGFDIYPTQLKWNNNLLQGIINIFFNYQKAFRKLQKLYPQTDFYFAEVEAQPWGSGQSWFAIISNEENINIKILNYYHNSLINTFNKYIYKSNAKIISLWGSEFWLVADKMGIEWPLNQIENFAQRQ